MPPALPGQWRCLRLGRCRCDSKPCFVNKTLASLIFSRHAMQDAESPRGLLLEWMGADCSDGTGVEAELCTGTLQLLTTLLDTKGHVSLPSCVVTLLTCP